jgi:tetratricopeptide (TPR) repeat protein
MRFPTHRALAAILVFGTIGSVGCATRGLELARMRYDQGEYALAAAALEEEPIAGKNAMLLHMERGMARQAASVYQGSADDWQAAAAILEALQVYSLTEGASSWLINDQTKSYTGVLYEHALMHALNANNYFARAMWDDAAVEARLIVDTLAELDGFPEVSYAHYVAGFAFEMIRDYDGARRCYERSAPHLDGLALNSETGLFVASTNAPTGRNTNTTLTCFVGIGTMPNYKKRDAAPYTNAYAPYVEFVLDDKVLGRSHTFSNAEILRRMTDSRLAAMRVAKAAARLLVKDAIADGISQENAALGELLRLVMFMSEVPDSRQWETLPRFFQVARIPCPADLSSASKLTLRLVAADGAVIAAHPLAQPLHKRGRNYVTFALF